MRTDRDAVVTVETTPPIEAAGSPRVWISRGPTGGLAYARIAIEIPDLEIERLDDVGLLCEILPESNHGRLGSAATRARLARVCDRLAAEPWILARTGPGSDASGAVAPRAVLLLSARSQAADEGALVQVLADAHLNARFDRGARAAAAKARARRWRDLARTGHLHAERIAVARLDPWAAVAERWQGPSALAILARAAEEGDESELLGDRLHQIHRALSTAPYRLQIVRDRHERPSGDSSRVRSGHAAEIPMSAMHAPQRAPSSSRGVEPGGHASWPARATPCHASATGAWIGAGSVNYCAKVYPAVPADHPDAGPLAVLAAFLGGDLLQRAVRERGGAYGAGARYCERTCTVRMFSYRDPRLAHTLRDFDLAVEALRRHPPEGRRLEEAILRTIREIDKPKAFQIDAFERYLDELQGRGSEGGRPLRASALGIEPGQLCDVAERYLSPELGRAGVLAGAGREAELDRLEMPWLRL